MSKTAAVTLATKRFAVTPKTALIAGAAIAVVAAAVVYKKSPSVVLPVADVTTNI